MKKLLCLALFISLWACNSGDINKITYPDLDEKALNFIVASDLGRNGYYEQKPIAELLGKYAENIEIEFIAAAGDIHHFNGVASTSDPLWMTNYELIYSHPELMIDWFVVCGNHEYMGNTQVVLDYSGVSRRWIAPARYYTNVFEIDDSTTLRLVFIDTTPLIDKYREDSNKYPDAGKQDMQRQLFWMDSVLVNSSEKWKIVIGHHPVYAQTSKVDSERIDMQTRVAPILEKYGVDVYYSGHIHNFQHIQPADSRVEYVVNSSASLSRKVKSIEGTMFCSDKAGFTVCSVTNDSLEFLFVDGKGNILYRYRKTK